MASDSVKAARLDGVASTARAARPYYVPVANEEQVFKAAFRQGLSMLLKGPTGCGKTRFLEAVAMAGGLTTYADKGNVTLLRYDEGKESCTRIDYRKVVSGEKPEFNIWLVPGDTIIVN